MYRLGERFLLLRAVVARGEDVRPYRDADEEVRQQPYERRVRADRRERVVPRVAPTTMMSAALKSSCKMLENISGTAKSSIFGKMGPLHIFILKCLLPELCVCIVLILKTCISHTCL